MECWNTDYEKRKTAYLQKMLNLHFMMMLSKQLFSAFCPIDSSINTRKSMQ